MTVSYKDWVIGIELKGVSFGTEVQGVSLEFGVAWLQLHSCEQREQTIGDETVGEQTIGEGTISEQTIGRADYRRADYRASRL